MNGLTQYQQHAALRDRLAGNNDPLKGLRLSRFHATAAYNERIIMEGPNTFEISSMILSTIAVITLIFFILPMSKVEPTNPRRRAMRSAALRPDYTLKPLAQRMDHDTVVNQQLESPLFAKLPPEVRDLIWHAAFKRYSKADDLYRRDLRISRPERRGPSRMDTSLLLTCRAIYLEAYEYPATVNPIEDFQGFYLDIPPRISYGAELVNRLPLWQFCTVQSYDLTLQQTFLERSWLSSKAFMLRADENDADEILKDMRRYWRPSESFTWPATKRQDDLTVAKSINTAQRLSHLTLRLNRTDWWTWTAAPESCDKLGLDPGLGSGNDRDRCTAARMVEEAELRRQGEWKGYTQTNCWGKDVGLFKNLRVFDLVLETFEAKTDQLDLVVECAKTWTFPRDEQHVLVFESVVSGDWEGVLGYEYEAETPWLRKVGPNGEDVKASQRFELRTVRYVVQRMRLE